MFDDLFPAERQSSLNAEARRPSILPPPPGAFTGYGSALADIIPSAGLTTASAFSSILDAYGKAAAYRDAPTSAIINAEPAPDLNQLQAQTIEKIGDNETGRGLRLKAKDYAPDPTAVGWAGQLTHGIGTSLAKAGLYSLTGPAAPILFGADVGTGRAQELSDQGVDSGTAAIAGLATGAAGAVGMKIPAAMGSTRLQSAALGAVINPALNVAEIGGIKTLLEHTDYPKIAEQYKPFDPMNLAAAAIIGGAFGAAFHTGKARTPTEPPRSVEPKLTPEETAAVLTMNEVKTREGDTLVHPADTEASNVARDAQSLARAQLDSGEAVSVAHDIKTDPSAIEEAYRRVNEGPFRNELDAAIKDGEIAKAEAIARAEEPLRQGDTAMAQERQTINPSVDEYGRVVRPVSQEIDQAITRTQHDAATSTTDQPGFVRKVQDVVNTILGRDQPTSGPDIPPAITADTPEQARAIEIMRKNPDALIPAEDGTHATADQMFSEVKDMEVKAQTDAKAYRAAIICALGFPA
jgi:hypothetical protein